ncbi:MAG: DMT family transporter, partial [Bacteroidota bacterium]
LWVSLLTMSNDRSLLSVVLLILLALIWGTSFILIKKGLVVFSPVEVAAIRVSVASLALIPFALIKRMEVKRDQYGHLFFIGMIGIFIPAFLFAWAQTRLESSLAGVLNSLSPLWTLIIGAFFFQQRFRGYVVLGIILSFAGALVLAFSRGGGLSLDFNAYALLVVLACALYGTNVNYIKFKLSNIGALTTTSTAVALVAPLGFIVLFGFTDFIEKLQNAPGAWMALGYLTILAVMSTAIANLIFNKVIKLRSPLFAASVTYIMPLVSVGWGLLDGEQLFLGHFMGMIAILGGVYLANKK